MDVGPIYERCSYVICSSFAVSVHVYDRCYHNIYNRMSHLHTTSMPFLRSHLFKCTNCAISQKIAIKSILTVLSASKLPIHCILQVVLLVLLDWQVGVQNIKEEQRFVSTIHGVLCVMTYLISMMLELHVVNWDIRQVLDHNNNHM